MSQEADRQPPIDKPLTSTTHIQVRYAETDAMAVVHHATYPIWFEVGRSDYMQQLGLPYSQVEAAGYYLMLSNLNVDYKRAARYDEHLTLTTQLQELKSRTMTFSYSIWRGDVWRGKELLSTGSTKHIITDKNYRPVRLPQFLLDVLEKKSESDWG